MRTGKKLWSLLLALVMVVSLFGGVFVVNAAEEAFSKTDVLEVGKQYVVVAEYDGKYYAVTYDGAVGAAEVKVDGDSVTVGDISLVWTLEDGNQLQSDAAEGIFLYPYSGGMTYSSGRSLIYEGEKLYFITSDGTPGYVKFDGAAFGYVKGDADAAAKILLFTGEFAAGGSSAFTKTGELVVGQQYVAAAEYEGKCYAITYDGAVGAAEIAVDGDSVTVDDAALVWTLEDGNQLQSNASEGVFLYPYSGGMTYSSGRSLIYEGDKLYFITSDGTPGYVAFDGAAFGYVKGNADAAAKIVLFTGEFAAASEGVKLEKKDYPEPETVRRAAVKNADGSITLAFTSDIHYDGKNMNLAKWLEAVEAECGYIDAFGFCGDIGSAYASGPDDFWTWGGAVMDYMDSQIAAGKVGSAIYTQGNHEWFPSAGGDYDNEYTNYSCATRYMQVGEGLVTDDYVIYCFGAGIIAKTDVYDYDEEDIAELDAYLQTAPTDIPIFILTHFPLHRWGDRTVKHANEVIDVLNKYGETHNLIVLWGHNHSNFDEYYYQPQFPGDVIPIDTAGTTRELKFTYMAAGCTADIEYTSPSAGSASVMNKGLVVTIGADGGITYKYRTIDGQTMNIVSPWMVRFRTGVGNYEVFTTQYVNDGQLPAVVEAPEFEGYDFKGWVTRVDNTEVPFDFSAPITKNTLVTASYGAILKPVAAPAAADCITIKPSATCNGAELTVTASGVGDLITVFDLSSIGYGSAIMYGFWFNPDGVVSFSQAVTVLYQGNATDYKLKAGEFYSAAGFGEHYIQLDDGNDLLLLEYENPGNYKSYPGDQPYSAYPGTVEVGAAEPAPAPVGTIYVVKPGDTLWSISKMFYGTGFRWGDIYYANTGIIKNPRMIYVGQVLQIP